MSGTRARIQPGDGDPRHGTINGYNNLKCRCDECRAANRAGSMEWRHRTGYCQPLDEYRATLTKTHGRAGTYANGCRCDECRKAGTAYRALMRRNASVRKALQTTTNEGGQ